MKNKEISNSQIVQLIAEAYRLENAYMVNPLFATETSLIDVLPHQLLAVYDYFGKKKGNFVFY
jgi:hypothetical protein